MVAAEKLADPKKCNIHFYSNSIPTGKIIPVLDLHRKPQTMNQKPWVQTLLQPVTLGVKQLSSASLSEERTEAGKANYQAMHLTSPDSPSRFSSPIPRPPPPPEGPYSTAREPSLLPHVSSISLHFAQEMWPLCVIHTQLGWHCTVCTNGLGRTWQPGSSPPALSMELNKLIHFPGWSVVSSCT